MNNMIDYYVISEEIFSSSEYLLKRFSTCQLSLLLVYYPTSLLKLPSPLKPPNPPRQIVIHFQEIV